MQDRLRELPRRDRASALRLALLEASNVLRPTGPSFEIAGVRHVPFSIWKGGAPVLNRRGRLHERHGRLTGRTGSVALPPLVEGSWRLDPTAALARAEQVAGVDLRRAPARVERGWLAQPGGTLPAWRITIPALRPFGTFQVTLDARTGEPLAVVDLIRHIEGVGRVYDPSPALSPVPSEVPLYDLDATGYLSGRVTQVFDPRAPAAFRPDRAFLYPHDDARFVQTSVYRGLTDTARYGEAHGVAVLPGAVRAYTNLPDPTTGGEFNNAFYDPFTPMFGFGNGDGVVTANLGKDLDVAAHEMGHHLFELLVQPLITSITDPVLAVHEAVSDTVAALIEGNPEIGESTLPGAPYLRTLQNTRRFPDDRAIDPHETGLIYAGANWDLVEVLGTELFADILFAGLPHLPPDPWEVEYRDALLEGDRTITGGLNEQLIRSVFSARGFDDLEIPPEFRGFLEDGLPESGALVDGELVFFFYWEFPGSTQIDFTMTGTGDADLIVASAEFFDPNDPSTYAVSQTYTSNEFIRLTPSTVPSVDLDDAWAVFVIDYDDFQGSAFTLTAEATLPTTGIFVNGPPVEGSLDEQGDIDFLGFVGFAGQVVRLEASALATTLDPLVAIVDPDTFTALGADDDSGPGTDSLIQGVRLAETKTYAVVVLSAVADVDPTIGTGGYRLRLTTCPNVGTDTDGDTLVDACDDDDDDDTWIDSRDAEPLDSLACADEDFDGCDDCSSGSSDPFADGPDNDADGFCDAGDLDDDNDGCTDDVDTAPTIPSTDDDFDFVGSDCDNCPAVSNPAQEDAGGLDTFDPDGIGDACQCGDVNGNGVLQINDASIIKRNILGLPPAMVAPERCNVIGTTDVNDGDGDGLPDDCAINDATVVKRAILGLGPGIAAVCSPAVVP